MNKFSFNLIYLSLFAGISFSTFAETNQEYSIETELDQINVVTELEKYKATDKLKSDVNLSLLGKQSAFTSSINVVNYDEKAIEETGSRNLVDAISKLDSSVMNFGGETNTLGGIYVRGLQLDARQFSVNGLAGLYSNYASQLTGIASAQLIKGASTATVGMDPEGSAGASVNIETKRATDKPINKIGFGWYANNRLQETFDFGRRFGENKEWGIRIGGLYRDGNTPRTGYSERDKQFSLGADYRGEKLRVGIDFLYAKRATKGGRARIQDIQNLSYALASAPNGKTNLIPNWSGQTTDTKTIMTTFEYDLPYSMMLSGGIGYMRAKYYGAFGQLEMQTADTYKIKSMRAIDFTHKTTSANLKLSGEHFTGLVSHNWSVAWDSVIRTRDHYQGKTATDNNIYNIYNPVLPSTASYSSELTSHSVDQRLQAHSLALADTLGFFDEQLKLTLGGRLQWIKQTNHVTSTTLRANRFSPMIASSWIVNPNLVFYANYLEDLEPGNADPDTGEMLSPRVTRQIETGVRKNWGENLTTTLSIYQLRRPGIVRSTGREQGEERNRGIELNIYASLWDGSLRPNLGITYNKGDLINFPTYSGSTVTGSQVASPRIIAKAGVEWDTPFIQNLTLNGAVQYYGSSYQNTAKTYKFPSYTTVDIGAKYLVKLDNTQSLTFTMGVENLFNESYWQVQRGLYDRSFAVLGMPRTYWANVEYSF